MKTLYLECGMGAAGDMLTAALLELHPQPEEFVKRLNALGLPGVEIAAEPMVKCGVTGTHMRVTVLGEEEESCDHTHDHACGGGHRHEHAHGHSHTHEQFPSEAPEEGHGHHHHAGMEEIRHILSHLQVSEAVRHNVTAVYELIAQAESKAHGKPVEMVHFHEVGALDAIADITAVCLLLEELKPDEIVASPVHVGSGHVHCAHGILPVPAPATAYILQGVPTYGGRVEGELCTPTGAALLKHFVSRFGDTPLMRVEKIGYGMGKKEFPTANCLRAMLGETEDAGDKVAELRCNLDDMTPEALGFAQERLWEAGALEVFTLAAGMKKNRPGVILACLCRLEDKEKMVRVLFENTTTLGVRETLCQRYLLNRSQRLEETPQGPVRIKKAFGWGVSREKPEYEDLARIARKTGENLAGAAELLKGK